MRKSKAASSLSATASSSAESSSTTSGPFSSSSSSSVPAIGSAGDGSDSGKNKESGSNIGSRRSTTAATINNIKSNTTTTTTATGSNSSSSGDGCSINGTRCSSNNDNNSNVQSAGPKQQQQQQQRPPLERQFDVITDPFARQFGVATAPLATFDTVDLSDEEVTTAEVTSTENTLATTTNTNSPSSNDNICRNKTTTTTTTTIATAATITAAKTHEIKTTHNITDTTSCSNSSNVSAASPRTSSTNNTNNTTITTTDQNTIPSVSSGKKGGQKSGVTHTTSGSNSTAAKKKKQSNNICGSSGKNSSLNQTDAITSSAKTNRVESISVRSLPDPDGVKDSVVTFEQSRVTDPHVNHSSSSDGEGSSHVATGLSSTSSTSKCKPDDSVSSVEPTRPTIGEEGSTAATPSAGTSAAAGATAGSALLTATVDFANFGSTEDLNSNNIGGSQSTSTVDGGGSATPVTTGGGAASKPKEVSTVEKASLLDDSSSSDSDLSPTEPNPSGGAYTTLTSGSTPNLIRKVSMHDATSTIKENSGQPMDFNSPELMTSSSKRKAYERRLQRLQVKTTPINRPRSATPLSVVTLDEYTNLSSPEISPNLEKLKIVLPADQFGRPIKSPRSKENAFDFNEDRLFRHTKEAIVLQSDGSIGQSPRRIFIPPTLSPSQSPCKAAAGSPVSKLVLVSRLPAGTSPLVKSAAPPVISPPPSSTTTSFSCSTSSASSIPAWQTSEKQWEQFDESHSKQPLQQPQATCAVPKRSEPPVALPAFERKQGFSRTGSFERSSSKGHKEHEKRKKKGSFGEESTKPTFEQHTDSRRNTTTSSTLNPSHHTHRVQMNCPDEEEEIIKIEIGSSDVGKAYNIELEVTAKEKMDPSHSKSSS